MKISQKEKDKVLSTSKAQSLMSSRKASMDVSRTYDNEDMSGSQAGKAIQVLNNAAERDSDQIENNPGLFCAEQTWPTNEELKQAK